MIAAALDFLERVHVQLAGVAAVEEIDYAAELHEYPNPDTLLPVHVDPLHLIRAQPTAFKRS